MIIDVIRSQLIQARKARDADLVTFYSTLLGEVEAVGKKFNKVTTDDEAVKKIRSWVNNIETNLSQSTNEDFRKKMKYERSLLEGFLPTMLTEEYLRNIVMSFLNTSQGNQGDLMKFMKETYPNQYDGKVVSNLYKELNQNV